jgi:hypothetical protein
MITHHPVEQNSLVKGKLSRIMVMSGSKEEMRINF